MRPLRDEVVLFNEGGSGLSEKRPEAVLISRASFFTGSKDWDKFQTFGLSEEC